MLKPITSGSWSSFFLIIQRICLKGQTQCFFSLCQLRYYVTEQTSCNIQAPVPGYIVSSFIIHGSRLPLLIHSEKQTYPGVRHSYCYRKEGRIVAQQGDLYGIQRGRAAERIVFYNFKKTCWNILRKVINTEGGTFGKGGRTKNNEWT